jgi:pilus assembly protein CpaF
MRQSAMLPVTDPAELGRGMLSSQGAAFPSRCVRANLSMIFVGAPGSGKTTMLSCCAAALDPSSRVVTAEEVFEADVPVANVD